ncbi:hypothetical protein N9Z19_00700 [Akkermansiaceae bacterium]|nr:hypothetical protein [Akkermansiaceae bacterium]
MLPNLLRWEILRPILKPITRIVVGLIAIPIFRLFLKHELRGAKVEEEPEHDLEQWFRAAVILLVATANMEHYIFGWVPLDLEGGQAWVGVFFRLLLVVGVTELMPDQALFGVIHGGAFEFPVGKGMCRKLWEEKKEWAEKVACKHLNRSSPVLAMMSAIFGGEAERRRGGEAERRRGGDGGLYDWLGLLHARDYSVSHYSAHYLG